MTGRLESHANRPALRFERRLEHSVARVWRAISEAMQAFHQLHERYAERFGLDPEIGRRNIAAIHAQQGIPQEGS